MTLDSLADPVLGNEGRRFGAGDRVWASFQTKFGPTGATVSVLVNLDGGEVPQEQRDTYLALEEGYSNALPGLVAALLERMRESAGAGDLPSPEDLQNQLELITINARRGPAGDPSTLLYLRTDPHESDWYVQVSEDLQVETCGMKD